MTIGAVIIIFFSTIGTCVTTHFLVNAIFDAVSASKEQKKKRQESMDEVNKMLDDIIEKLDEILRNLQS